MPIEVRGGSSVAGGISLGWGSNQDGSSQEFSNGERSSAGATVDTASRSDALLVDVPSGAATADWQASIDAWESDGLRLDGIDASGTDRILGVLLIEVDRQRIDAEAIPSQAAWGTPTVQPGTVTLSPSSIPSQAAWGSPTLSPGAVTVSPGGIASAAVWGLPEVQPGTVTLSPSGIASVAAWGFPTLSPGAVTITASSIPPAASWGTPSVLAGVVTVEPGSFGLGPVWGSPTVLAGVVLISPSGIPSAAAWGTPSVLGGNPTISPTGIPSAAAWGIPFLTGGVEVVTLKALIENALRERAQLGSFYITVRNTETRQVTAGAQVQPAEVETNEVASAYEVARDYGRDYIQDRKQWQWLLILRFHQEVITEVFENALLRDPVLVPRDPDQGITRQARLLLLDSKVQHPPRGGSSNGTEVTYRFTADLGHA